MDLEIRPVAPDEFERYVRAVESAFGAIPSAEEIQVEGLVKELDRTLAVFDGPDIVGSTAAYSLRLTVPGGVLPMAGVTAVAVVPTHRRRGILTELMRRQLADVRDRGEALAGLWASEGAIYQRFGYGLAALHATFEIDSARVAFVRELPPDPGRLRLVDRDEAMRAMPQAYELVRPAIPGMLERPDAWWQAFYSDLESHRHGFGPLLFALHETDGRCDGYVAYRTKDQWEQGVPRNEATVHELIAADPAVYASLWRFALNLDLVATVSGWRRPADEPLLYMLTEPRRMQFKVHDALWLRLVDVPRALEARSYAARDRLVFQVRDAFCPWNEGRYELVTGEGGAGCSPTEAEPDLHIDVADLGAVYLGGTTFHRLVRASRVAEGSAGAVERADALFRTPSAPWCPHVF